MGLEAAAFIANLNLAWPLGTDSGTFGDDHLRLIKSVLKGTFPGSGGQGFSKQITATEDEINHLSGTTSSIQDQINALQASVAAMGSTEGLLSPQGYQYLMGGLLMQWGNSMIPANGTLVVTLPTPFPTAYLQSVITALGSGSGVSFGSDGSTTTITLYNMYAANQNVRWLAIGH